MITLRGGDVNMIGICGMGGLGKTTMAEKIMRRARKENVFEEVVMVVVSHNVDILKIQNEINWQLRLEKLKDKKLEQSERVDVLQRRLLQTKRTLLILDDIWEGPPLKSIGIPRDSKWCTIIFTSRNTDVLHDMNVRTTFRIEVLSPPEAWSFFRERAGTCVEDREVNHIAKEVAKECGGLPINLAAIDAGLRDERDTAIWEHSLTQLKENVPDNVQSDENYKPLEWSYDRLDSKKAQSIFLLCCLFPKDANIPLEYLTYFSMGLCIFEEEGITYKKAWNLVCKETKMLKDRSLLLDSDKKHCVRMHDVVRVVCTSIAKRKGYIGKHGGRWISSSHLVEETKELLSKSRCPSLRLLFLNRRYDSLGFEFDNAFLEGMRELHVLSIENYYSLTILSIGKLINTLILDSCHGLETKSVVGELVNLKILICRNCKRIEKLPLEMKGLNRLKVLELIECENLQSIGRGIISSLFGLEELKMSGSFNKWEGEDREERENARLRELEALPNLACLEIDIQDASLLAENMPLLSKKIVRFIIRTFGLYEYFPSEFSKALCLWFGRETRLGDWIEMQLLRDTESLYLNGGANNVDLAKSENIRWLKLEKCESMKNVIRTSGGDDATVFPLIEHLQLYSLPALQEICDGPISSNSFQNLNELELRDLTALTQFCKRSSVCENINYVPHFTNLSSIVIEECHGLRNLGELSMAGKDSLSHLKKLHIVNCEMMEQVFLWNNEEVITKVFPKLKEMELHHLPNLTIFYQGIQGIEFPLLKGMEINDCPKMKSIIGSSSVDIDDSWHLLCQPQNVSSFSSLEILTIIYVGSECIFTFSVAANLVSLRELCIRACYEMKKVITEDEQQQERILLFPKLEELTLFALPKLVSFCDWKCEVELPSLRKVEISYCLNMENFSMGLVATPKLAAFTTDLTTYVGVGVDVAFNSLKELEIIRSENPLYHHTISVSLFNRLEKLEFCWSEGRMSLFSSSAVGNLVNLKVLYIRECYKIVKVIEEEEDNEKVVVSGGEIRSVVFSKLEEICLEKLPKLVRFSEWKCDVELHSLTKVEITRCPNIESFSMGFVAAPNLKSVKINAKEIGATKDLNGTLQQHHLARLGKGGRQHNTVGSISGLCY